MSCKYTVPAVRKDISTNPTSPDSRVRDSDGRLEDVGDFSDFFIPPSDEMDESQAKELQENQDMELARLLQEQEHKVSSIRHHHYATPCQTMLIRRLISPYIWEYSDQNHRL